MQTHVVLGFVGLLQGMVEVLHAPPLHHKLVCCHWDFRVCRVSIVVRFSVLRRQNWSCGGLVRDWYALLL